MLASVSGDGKSIVLALHPRVNTDVQLVPYATLSDYDSDGKLQSTFDINLPQFRTQELATRMVVKSGETVVMGGVLERQRSTFVESVPVLGDIPIIGVLFRRRTEKDTPRYLLVFVTATILKDTGEFLILEDNPEEARAAAAGDTSVPAGPASRSVTNSIEAVTPPATNPPPAVATPAAPPAAAAPASTNPVPAAVPAPATTNTVAPPAPPPATNPVTPPK